MRHILITVALLTSCASNNLLDSNMPPDPMRGMEGVVRLTDEEVWNRYLLRQLIILQSPY
jgi:hypothetical protein